MITILNIAEQVRSILGRGNLQELIQACKNAYASSVKALWFEGRADGVSEIGGSFIYTFNDVKTAFDENTNQFYITIPSSYIELPHDIGINQVSFKNSQDKPFIRFAPASFGLFSGLKSFAMGGNQPFSVEGNRMYFPKMKEEEAIVNNEPVGILLKLTVALDTIEADEPLNISPLVQDSIVSSVLQKYQTMLQDQSPERLT